jgi:gas vesicle protein
MNETDELAPVSKSVTGDDDPEKIRADIERTRAQMSNTIGAIQDKLRPEDLKSQAMQQLQEVKEKLKEELHEQVDELKEKIKEEVRDAKERLREATVGKVEHMVHNATDRVEHAGGSLVETVKANPIPAALVGIGVAWLLMNRRSARALPRADYRVVDRRIVGSSGYLYEDEFASADYDPRYGRDDLRGPGPIARLKERVGEGAHRASDAVSGVAHRASDAVSGVAHDVGDAVSGAAHRASDAVSGVAHDVGDRARGVAHKAQETAHDLAERARGAASKAQHAASDLAVRARGTADDLAERTRYGVRRAEDRLQTTYEANPLALGAVALLAGLAVGLSLPRTRREDRLMGQTRDRLLQRAQEAAHETIEKVQGSVQSSVEKRLQNGTLLGQGRSGQSNVNQA